MDFVFPIIFEYTDLDTLSIIYASKVFEKQYADYETRCIKRMPRYHKAQKYLHYFAHGCFGHIPEIIYELRFDIPIEICYLFPWMQNLQQLLFQRVWETMVNDIKMFEKLREWYVHSEDSEVFEDEEDSDAFWNDLDIYVKMFDFAKKNNMVKQFEMLEAERERILCTTRAGLTMRDYFDTELRHVKFNSDVYIKYAVPFRNYINTDEFAENSCLSMTHHFEILACDISTRKSDMLYMLTNESIPDHYWRYDFWMCFCFRLSQLEYNVTRLVSELTPFQKHLFDAQPEFPYKIIENMNAFVSEKITQNRPEWQNDYLATFNVLLFMTQGKTTFKHRSGSIKNSVLCYLIKQMSHKQRLQFIDVFPECLTDDTYLCLKREANDKVVTKFIQKAPDNIALNLERLFHVAHFYEDLQTLTKRYPSK